MKKKWLIIGLLIMFLVGGTTAYRVWARNQNSESASIQTATVERGDLEVTLGASGNSRSMQSATITWNTSGKVGEVALELGDHVEEDQLLAELDPNTLSSDVVNAKLDLITAEEALDDLKNSKLKEAEALQAVEEAQTALDNIKNESDESASQAQLALAEAQEAYDSAYQNRLKMNYPHSTDALVIEKAETDYLLAKRVYKNASREYQKYENRRLTNRDRVRALDNLVAAEKDMNSKFATYNWYLLGYTETDIAQADAALAVAEANLETAQAEYDRLKEGYSSGDLAMAEAVLADAQREYERVKDGPSQADIEAAQATIDAAQADIDAAKLLAPFSGTITEVSVSSGDLVDVGNTAFRIDDLSTIYIDLQISEVDLPSIEVGQQAIVVFDAIADKEYTAEVTDIGMIGSVSQGVVNYPVTIRITNADDEILPGMTASVTLILSQVNDVILVPNKAIRTSNGQKNVIVLFEGQQISVPVTVGLVGDSMTEITSSQIQEGDTVIVGTSSNTTDSTSGITNNGNMDNFMGPTGDFGGPPPAGMP